MDALLRHLPDRIEDNITLQSDNSLNESGSKLPREQQDTEAETAD